MKLKLFLFIIATFFISVSNLQAGVQGPNSGGSIRHNQMYTNTGNNRYGLTAPSDTVETYNQAASKSENNSGTNTWRMQVTDNPAFINTPGNLNCTTDANDMMFCLDEKNKPFTGRKTVQFNENRYKSIENFKNGYKDGLCTYFDNKGQRKERSYYKKGLKNGTHKLYYSDNHIKVLTNYKNGVIDGMLDVYLSDSTLLGRMKYKKGYLEKGFCKKDGKKEDFSYEYIKSFPYNTINSCGIPL